MDHDPARSGADGAMLPRPVVVEHVDAHTVVVVAAPPYSPFALGSHVTPASLDGWTLVPLVSSEPRQRTLALLVGDDPGRADHRTKVALVIDDELANRDYYTAAFDQLGWRAESAPNGSAGILAFAADPPAVCLVDVRLPDMNGYDVCRQLRTLDRRQCLVVLMSADPSMVEPQRAASAGADLALVGPIGIGQLRTITEQRPLSPVRLRTSLVERPASSSVRLHLFGEPEIVLGDQRCPLPAGAATDIISVLAIHHPAVLTTADLGELAWSPPAASSSPVHTALSRMRSALQKQGIPDLVVTSAQGYRLDVQAGNIDTVAFERAASALDPNLLDDRAYVDEALRVLANVSDSAFGGSRVPAVEAARVRIWEARAVLEERVAVRQIVLGETTEAVAAARRLTARELWRESAWTILVAALYHSGRQREALETFQVARNLLVNSVGVDPSPALRDVERRVLTQDALLHDPAFVRALAR